MGSERDLWFSDAELRWAGGPSGGVGGGRGAAQTQPSTAAAAVEKRTIAGTTNEKNKEIFSLFNCC